jgi:hypothetical protein
MVDWTWTLPTITEYQHHLMDGYDAVLVTDVDEIVALDRIGRYWINGVTGSRMYNKPALSTEPMRWKPGFHSRADDHYNFHPDLRRIHLHRMDYDICLERHRLRRQRSWNQHNLELGWGTPNLFTEDEEFARWFCTDSRSVTQEIALERIPRSWKGLF